MHSKAILKKGSTLTESTLFTFRVDPFSKGMQKIFTTVPPLEVHPFRHDPNWHFTRADTIPLTWKNLRHVVYSSTKTRSVSIWALINKKWNGTILPIIHKRNRSQHVLYNYFWRFYLLFRVTTCMSVIWLAFKWSNILGSIPSLSTAPE